jgi:hypothetical protein
MSDSIGQFGLKTGVKAGFHQGANHIDNMITTAGRQSVARLKNASAVVKDASNVVKNKLAKDTLVAARLADNAITQVKNITSSRKIGLVMDEIGDVGKVHHPVENTHAVENRMKDVLSKINGVNIEGATKGKVKLSFENVGEYFSFIGDIGKRSDLSTNQKLEKIHEAYKALGESKGDVTVVSSIDYLKPEGFGPNGRMIIDWPEKMGFLEGSIQPVNRGNPLPEQWDRIGGKAGENFTTLPNNDVPYSYDQRAIPYLENETARHVGTFKNEIYFDAIDAIKSGNREELNRIIISNGKNPASMVVFDRFKAHYDSFLENVKNTIGDIDAPYGLKGVAAPWHSSSTGGMLMNGGAEQIVTPLNGEMLEIIGVISKY